jgi:hypothetical protein
VTAIIVVLALFAILGIATIAVDGGVLQTDRRWDQNASDHSALAAAWAHCHGDDPDAAGHASALRNGFDDNGSTNTVTVTDLGDDPDGRRRFKSEITSVNGTAFASTVGHTELNAIASAIAACVPGGAGGGGFAIFASGNCKETIHWSGNDSTVVGAVHSNNEIKLNGNDNTATGDVTYEDAFNESGSNNDMNEPPGPQVDGAPDDPDPYGAGLPGTLFDIEKFKPTGEKAEAAAAAGKYYNAGTQKIDNGWLKDASKNGYGVLLNESTGQLAEGLYYTSGEIDVGVGNMTGKVTFVSSASKINLSASDQTLTHYDPDGLLAFSMFDETGGHNAANPKDCGKEGVTVSGQNSEWTGIIYSPWSMVQMSGSDNSSLFGSLVGYEVRINGNFVNINYQDFGGDAGDPSVLLLS